MDIQKEREAFESQKHIKPYLNNVIFDSINNKYISEDDCEIICSHSAKVVNSGWQSWQAAKTQAVPEGFVLVEIKDLREIISNASDAMDGERTSRVYDESGEPSTWFDHYTVAENKVLKVIEAQEQSHDGF